MLILQMGSILNLNSNNKNPSKAKKTEKHQSRNLNT